MIGAEHGLLRRCRNLLLSDAGIWRFRGGRGPGTGGRLLVVLLHLLRRGCLVGVVDLLLAAADVRLEDESAQTTSRHAKGLVVVDYTIACAHSVDLLLSLTSSEHTTLTDE